MDVINQSERKIYLNNLHGTFRSLCSDFVAGVFVCVLVKRIAALFHIDADDACCSKAIWYAELKLKIICDFHLSCSLHTRFHRLP